MPDEIADPDEKIEKLKDYFQQQTGCRIAHEWKIDLHCHRFYFQNGKQDGWQYILDVYQGDLEEQEVSEIIVGLNAGKWQKVLQECSGKRIPCFKDKKFAPASTFREWPTT
jgi:hypothetical protein